MTVKFESVVVSARVKAMSRPSVVLMVLPPLYADCNVIDAAEHFTTLLEPSIQRVLPVVVVSPATFRNESASVTMLTSLVPLGVKVD